MAVNPNTNFTTGQVATSDQMNRFPRGVMGYVKRTAGNLSVGTTAADLTSMSVTFTAVANRLYLASALATGQKQAATGWTGLYFADGANSNYGSVYQTVGAGQYFNISASTVYTFSAGTQTIKLRGQVENNTSILQANGTDSLILVVQDLGPI